MSRTILVADDDESIRDTLETLFELEGYAVRLAVDGRSALEQARRPPTVDLIVLDWMMPEMDGLEVCKELRRLCEVPILMLTARGELESKVVGLDSGADDYLPKPFKTKELLARVRALLRRSRPADGQRLSYGSLALDPACRSCRWQDRQVVLTALEFQLLRFLVEHAGQVFSKEQLLNQVWGWHEVANPNVVEVHISGLRQKLGQGARDLIRTVRGLGYTLGG